MSELQWLQDQFQLFLVTGQSEIDLSITATEQVSVDTRLSIYRTSYRLRLLDCLVASFTALQQYLGAEEFEKICDAFIAAHPSHYRSIRWYGDTLADFLKHYNNKEYAYLAEFAEFEWNMTLAFDAADTKVITVEDMASVPPQSWAGLQFTPHPSLQRMNYCSNVPPVWLALVNEQTPVELVNKDQATPWVLWRTQEYEIKFHSLSVEEAWALDVMIQGLSFGELCEGLCQWVDVEEVGMRAATYLKNWIQHGMISSYQ